MKIKNGKIYSYDIEEMGDYRRINFTEIQRAIRAWEIRRGYITPDKGNDFLFGKRSKTTKRERNASMITH